MNQTTPLTRTCQILAAAAVLLAAAAANTAKAMPEQQRLAIIKGLKIKGIVGENNQGLLEFRGKTVGKEVVDEENQERKKIYQSIAQKNGTSWREVGKVQAKRNADLSPAGTWIQNPDGSWRKK